MNVTRFVYAALTMLLGVTAAAAPPPADREITRLEQLLETIEAGDLPKDVAGLIPSHRDALARAKRASSPEYRLYRLRDPFVGIETLAFVAKHHEAARSVEDFRKLWESQRSRFEAAPAPSRGTLLARGLAESTASRAERLFHASLPYSKAAEPWSGVYYLGEAEGNLRFRELLQRAGGKTTEKTPSRARLASMLDELEQQTLAFFGKDVTNQQPIAVSVRLKEARELLAAQRLAGATLLAVEARAALSRRGGPFGTYRAVEQATSVGAMLRAWAGDEEEPMRGALQTQVAPFLAALFGSAPQAGEPAPATVTVTLVRWPYT